MLELQVEVSCRVLATNQNLYREYLRRCRQELDGSITGLEVGGVVTNSAMDPGI